VGNFVTEKKILKNFFETGLMLDKKEGGCSFQSMMSWSGSYFFPQQNQLVKNVSFKV